MAKKSVKQGKKISLQAPWKNQAEQQAPHHVKRRRKHAHGIMAVLSIVLLMGGLAVFISRISYDTEARAEKFFCQKQDIAGVYVCGNYIETVSSFPNADSTIYKTLLAGVMKLETCPRTAAAGQALSPACTDIVINKECGGKPLKKIC